MSFPAVTCEEAAAAGFAVFNEGPHVCLDLPSSGGTISCRTPAGKLVTFAFCRAEVTSGDEFECIDVDYANAPGPKIRNGRHELSATHAVGFTPGRQTFNTVSQDPARLNTLVAILLHNRYYREQ